MRVFEITQRYPPAIGGVEDHVVHLTRHLRAAGIDVTVVTTDLERDRPFHRLPGGTGPSDLAIHRHRAVLWVPLPHGLGIVAPGMVREALTADADVVHAHAFGYPPTWSAALRKGLGRGPVVITPHSDEGQGGPWSSSYGKAMTRWTLTRADRVIALTERERRLLEERGVTPERIRLIPNGIDMGEFPPGAPTARTAGPFRILFVGRLYPAQKGIDTLLDAFDRVSAPAELRFVGEDWGALAHIQGRSLAAPPGSRILPLGRLSRPLLLAEYAAADVVVVPSRFEPFGIVLLEAMAAGKPVVASRVGGIPEIVLEGETGLLVEPGDSRALAAALEEVRADPARARRWGQAGRRRAESYSWDRLAPQFLTLFEELLRK